MAANIHTGGVIILLLTAFASTIGGLVVFITFATLEKAISLDMMYLLLMTFADTLYSLLRVIVILLPPPSGSSAYCDAFGWMVYFSVALSCFFASLMSHNLYLTLFFNHKLNKKELIRNCGLAIVAAVIMY